MTSERLQEILDEISDNGTRIMRPHMVMKAMKQAVNEALEECADKAEAWVDDNGEWISLKVEAKVSKQSILKLKIL